MNATTVSSDEASGDDPITKAAVFVDVVASTDFARIHGDQTWRNAVHRHERAVAAIVERHGGEVASFTGDGFLLLFDEPGTAVACALRLRLANDVQHVVEIRMGIEYGEFLPYGPGRYVGYTLHLASRITDLSDAGEITMSDECLRRARRTVALPPTIRRTVSVRGCDSPLTVHTIRDDHRA